MNTNNFDAASLLQLEKMGKCLAVRPSEFLKGKNINPEKRIDNFMDVVRKNFKENADVSDFGFLQTFDNLTRIRQEIVDQKHFTIPLGDFFAIKVGEGTFDHELLTYSTFEYGSDFESGDIDQAVGSRLNTTEIAVKDIRQKIKNWAKKLGYNWFQMNQAAAGGNAALNFIAAKERSLYKNYQLGLQNIAFLGHKSDSGVEGLLNQSDVNINLSVITGYLKDLSDADFMVFISKLMEAYRANANRTVYPDTFVIPEADWNGLGVATSVNFPSMSRRDYLINEFKTVTKNSNAKVLPCAYCDSVNNNLGVDRYMLYNSDPSTLDMNIPLVYTSLAPATGDNFNFEAVSLSQYTGVKIYRPLEALYFDF